MINNKKKKKHLSHNRIALVPRSLRCFNVFLAQMNSPLIINLRAVRIVFCSLAFISLSNPHSAYTPLWIIFTLTSSFCNFSKLLLIASKLPCVSALIITGKVFNCPSATIVLSSSKETLVECESSF